MIYANNLHNLIYYVKYVNLFGTLEKSLYICEVKKCSFKSLFFL